jgi:hypothetical protein
LVYWYLWPVFYSMISYLSSPQEVAATQDWLGTMRSLA